MLCETYRRNLAYIFLKNYETLNRGGDQIQKSEMNHDNYRPGRLSLSTMNQGIIRAEYAVRGELVIKALEIQRVYLKLTLAYLTRK